MKFAAREGFESYTELRESRGDQEMEKMEKNRVKDVRFLTKWKTTEISEKYRLFCQELESILEKEGVNPKKEEKKKHIGIVKERKKNDHIQAGVYNVLGPPSPPPPCYTFIILLCNVNA